MRGKKIILVLLICIHHNDLVSSDRFSIRQIFNLGTGAAIGGVAALMSGFSASFATLTALAGSWLSAEW